ncbi:MAG TPA: hypothetical protein VLW85_16280 [Myxococcales bacterium]|nr:hypothetical protein [Myxococcales bacterium]
MLAYTFWHWPNTGAADYEARLRRFHEAMRAAPPAGFRGSYAFRHGAAPWLPGPAYLDWYLVDGFAELQSLNDGAISLSRKEPHDAVAAQARGGAGGVYKLYSDDREPKGPARWFSKPDGMRYDQLLPQLKGSAWMRQMVLGPSPEFVVFGADVPPGTGALTCTLERVA